MNIVCKVHERVKKPQNENKQANDFYNTDQYRHYGEACSSRTNVCHRSYTSTEPFSPLFRVYHVNVG